MTTFLPSGVIWSCAYWGLVSIIFGCLITYYFAYVRQIKRWKECNIPFLQPTFPIGDRHFFNFRYSIAHPFDQIYNENLHKDLIGFFLGLSPFILVKDEKLTREILGKHFNKSFTTGFHVPEAEKEVQYMIQTAPDKHHWKISREILKPVFAVNWIQSWRFDLLRTRIDELLLDVEKESLNGNPITIDELTRPLMLNIVASTFGLESNSPEITSGFRTILETIFELSYRRLFCFLSVYYAPYLQKFECFRLFPHKLLNIMSDILQRQMEQRDQMNTEKDDLIDIFRSVRCKPESNFLTDTDVPSSKKEITIREMTGLGFVIILGGVDTVGELLGFLIHSLSLYPEYQRNIRKEVQEVMKARDVSTINFQVIQDLSFTFQCLHETSRMYPVGPISMRRCTEDFPITGTDYIFRKGDTLVFSLYSTDRDRRNFRNPHKFDPERFSSEKIKTIPAGAQLNFGYGPRRCPGYNQGFIVAAAIIASLLSKYEIKPHSHLKQMDATDFHPKGLNIYPRKKILVKMVPHKEL